MSAPSFRFRLERLRALRERSEDAAKQELATAMLRHQESQQRLHAATEAVARARDEHLAAAGLPASGSALQARQAYIERTQRERIGHQQELAREEQEVAGKRAALQVAARERRTLERLKEQRRTDHVREQNRQEGLELDEMALNAFRRSAA